MVDYSTIKKNRCTLNEAQRNNIFFKKDDAASKQDYCSNSTFFVIT